MKRALIISIAALSLCACNKLNTAPEDYYASGNYWTTTAQVEAYMSAINSQLRGLSFNHTILFGEQGAGIYRQPISCTGNSVANPAIIMHTLSQDVPGVSNWGGYYTALSHCNLYIEKVEACDFMPKDEQSYLLAEVYGIRAFLYFDLYRIYGGVPLRLIADVAGHGVSDVNELYLERATATETMNQIMSDVKKSIELFGNKTSFNPYGMGSKVYWNKAASECLAAEALLWSTKVTVGDNKAKTDGSLLTEAKSYLKSVENNYGLALQPKFTDVFSATNKANSEIIFAIHNGIGEASNSYGNFFYTTVAGTSQSKFRKTGEPFGDPMTLVTGYNQTYEYLPEMYLKYEGTSTNPAEEDIKDTRADGTFFPLYDKTEDGGLTLVGTITAKNIGEISNGIRVMDGDVIYYRLAWVYATLAEIANYEGNSGDFVKYINLIRQRAYGENWDENKYGAKYGSFAENELTILEEKDKEFVQEGQRWWDIRRLQTEKGQPEKNVIFSVASDPTGNAPVLSASDSFRALWPISKAILDNDPKLTGNQNPGY